MAQETPFKIAIPGDALELLNKKLALTRLPDELDDAGWDYGVPLNDIRRLVALWKDGYDWRKHEKALNDELPQFTRNIEVSDGHGVLSVHYIHKKSSREGAIPLLFVHGWPGCFIEVRKILPLLTAAEDGQPSFHVVGLGMAGYGFSEGAKKKGFDISKYAEVGHKLMLSLGYNEYVTQGGDWGTGITQHITAAYGPTHVKAWHSNMPYIPSPPPHVLANSENLDTLDPIDRKAMEQRNHYTTKGNGYWWEQSTQPQTLGYSLADSPVGLLAWIYEKLITWTDNYPWEDDEVLTWISIYWFSLDGPAASLRTYYECRDLSGLPVPSLSVPFGCSSFPNEIIPSPASWLTDRNVVFSAIHERGGHFAAHEVPELLVGDLRKMFGKGGPAYGVVEGKDGY